MEQLFHFDIKVFIEALGYLGIFLVVFSESGLLIGMFFPGDSLLFTAGLLASLGMLNIWVLVAFVMLAAVMGDSVGYWLGKTLGPKIFNRSNSYLFDKKYIERAHNFYAKHGAQAIILARFVPIIRTVVPTIAGVGRMEYKTFLKFNVTGGVLWGAFLPLLGFFLGKTIPNIDHYLLLIIFAIIIVSFIPVVIEVWRGRGNG
jgi:membrane-associated protein